MELLITLTSLCNKLAPSLLPIKFVQSQRFTTSIQTIRSRIIWSTVNVLLFVLSVTQLIIALYFSINQNLICILFHGFMIIVCWSGGAAMVAYHKNPPAFCCLLNSMFHFPNGFVGPDSRVRVKIYITMHMALVLSIITVVTFFHFCSSICVSIPVFLWESLVRIFRGTLCHYRNSNFNIYTTNDIHGPICGFLTHNFTVLFSNCKRIDR